MKPSVEEALVRQQLIDSMPDYEQRITLEPSSSDRMQALKQVAERIGNEVKEANLAPLSLACKERSSELMGQIDRNDNYDYQDFKALVCDVIDFCANATEKHFAGGLEENIFEHNVQNSLADPRMINDFAAKPAGALVAAELEHVFEQTPSGSLGSDFLKTSVSKVMNTLLENSTVISALERDSGVTLEQEYGAKIKAQQQAAAYVPSPKPG